MSSPKMDNQPMRSPSVDVSSIHLVIEALQAASCAVEGTAGDSFARQWELVSTDSVAGSFFLRSLSISLGLELPTSLLQCRQIEEVAAKITELAAGVGTDSRNKVPLHTIHIHQGSPRVAIISASCRLPGGVETLGDLWSNILLPGRDAITPIPPSRWDADMLYDPEGGEGTIYVREGGFIEEAEAFDNRFFEIPDHEAAQMDPQQRLLLEAAFEARAPLMKGRKGPTDETGVFIGCSCADWFLVHAKLTTRDTPSCFIVDLQHAMLANRISYCMNLEGASMTIDTATSSGIVAFSTAVSHIESGRLVCALAGSSQLIIAPEVTVALCNLGMLSRKGRCRPFDEASDGFIRSEGVVVFSLLREDYVAEYVDTSAVSPLAYVRGHAVVHSGRAFSTTAPSEGAERRAMEGALTKANISPDDVDYIEAHGTGTRMGDAVEVQSLAAVFGDSHDPERPLLVGSIKGNIGHCEGSSGGAGICKAILVLINRCVPGTLHFNRLSSLIDRVPKYFSIPRTATRFPVPDRPLVVGVSSFGVGGCNGHVILEGPAAGQHDFKAQLNDKCLWKKNMFPWSHLISMPGGSNGEISPVELITPEGCIPTPTSSFCGTNVSVVGPSTDQDVGRNGPVVFTEVPVLGPSNAANHRRPKEPYQDGKLSSTCWGSNSLKVAHTEFGTFSSNGEEPDVRPDSSSHFPERSPRVPVEDSSPDQKIPASSAPTISREQIRAAINESLKLALNRDEPLQDDTPFVEAGVDSMTSIGIREGLSKRLKLQLPATLLYDHPCIAQLVDYLEKISSTQEADVSNSVLFGVGRPTARSAIAVTAMACRFPSKAHCDSEFWEALQSGQDCIQHIPLTRFDPWKYRDSDRDLSNKLYVNDAGTYPDMALFDNALFNISMAEAQLMDPHQRVLLEVCHEALAEELRERNQRDIAIVVGCCNNDWVREACTSKQEVKSLTGTGGAASIISNRVSHVFNLHGPSMTIDTACSSSLVALDVAKRFLNDGRCNTAVAAGVHILINHHVFEQYCKASMLSVDGRCKTFDASANGYVRSEGCGALLLKALPRETTDPATVYAWIRGAANNHVGRSASLTAPNGPAQQAVIRAALRDGRVQSPADVAVLEAHGTGTSLGDPIEVGAVRAVYCNGFVDSPPLIVGALKTVMGHAEGAAGIAGLIKLILVLQHRVVTPNLHLNVLNPHIDISRGDKYRGLMFPSKCVPLGSLFGIRDSDPLLGAVSSFGFGGSNAHAIVEVGPTFKSTWMDTWEQNTADQAECRPKVIWLFTGQGSQYLDMACAYFHHSAVFRDMLAECTACLKEMHWFPENGPQSIEDMIYGAPDRKAMEELLSQTRYSQVAIVAIELGLSKVLLERGMRPDIVIGHSLGEYAAASVAGVMGWRDALCLVAKRASLLAAQPKQDGVMVACRLSAAAVESALSTDMQHLHAVALAGDNAPQSVTVAGTKEEVDALLGHLGVLETSKRLQVSHAFHSPLMAGAVPEMEAIVAAVNLQPASITIASTVRGRVLDPSETQDPHYWGEQLTLPVRFREAVEAAVKAADSDHIVFVEVGPQRTLVNLASQILGKKQLNWVKYYELAGRDRIGESRSELEASLEQISTAASARPVCLWNHKKFPFPFETAERQRAPATVRPTEQEVIPLIQGPLWKMTWKEFKQQSALHTSLSDRAQNWLFCGVPKEHVSSFRSLLKSSNIGDAVVVEAGCIEPDSPLPSLPSGRIDSVVFVGGLWRTSSSTACLDELRAVLLAYSRSAQSDPEFRPPFCAIVNCSNSSFGIPTQHNPNKHGADFDIRQAGLLGMCRTSRLEVQRLCKRPFQMLYVNVEDDSAGCLSKAWSWIDTQCGLLNTSSALIEEDVVITSDCHMVPRLEQVSTSQSANRIAVTSKKSYVVTGGTGGLGLSVAEWLLKNGAGMVALLSRSGKPANTLLDMPAWKTVEEGMNAHRAAIMLCDVADAQRLMDTLSKIHKSIPIGGIFHCAGYEGEASIVDTSLRSIERVYEPKAHGAWNLHLACQELDLDRDLDMFVLFSSISTLPGNDALATYAAANAYLDSLSYWRRSQGLKAQSIQWGPWNDVGMVTRNEKLDRVFKSRGIKPFMPEEGIKVMEMALETEEPCVCALNVNWKKYSQAFGHNAPLALAEIQSEVQIQPKSTRAEGPSKESIEAIVIEAAESLVDTDSRISPDTRLDELGLDSLGSVELRNLLQDRLAMSLPASLLVEFATLGEVIEYIAEDLCGGQAWGSTTRTPDPKPHLSGASEEGFAVIGMGCRLPGKSNSPEEFWDMLLAETDCVEDIPWQRFNIQPLFDPDPEENKCYVKEAALLDNAHLFDNEFFQMTESQARNIDPQQRVLLEVAYETFVDAQYKREEVKGQEIGVFCATYTNDYHLSSLTKGENGILAIGEGVDGGVPRLGEASGYPEPGSLMCLIPNRISYSFGLIGPSIGVDTACASGLVALDTAVMKLRLSACTKAFVGAVSLILVPCFFLGGSKTRQFAKSGRCRTFDAAADGLVRGEGAAGVLLAPLSAARSESKFVHAIVRGTAISHYGRGARLTAPNTRALARVMNLALNDGGVDQKMVRCYEAHGTATVLGDIIEMNALKQVFEDRPKETPLIVGTAHNNIGHLDSAAALVAFIKTVLSLKHRYVPPNIQFNKMHPDITAFDTSRIVYVREGQAIRTADNQTKIFGANLAYGLGGTVVAAITEEGDDPAKAPQVTRHVWKHNSFPLDSQKFVFLLGAAALLAQDRKQTPRDDVAYLVGCICKNMLTRQNLASLSPCIPPDLVSEIFLTGATGLTGSQILLSLLEQQIDCGRDGQKRFPRVYCLVQARDRMHAMYRIVDAVIGRGGQWKQRYFEQVVPVVGDLRAPRLGLSQKTFDALTSTVEAVYHAGRVVDFALPYEAIRKANVLSLLPLVEMCTTGKAKHLHVLSDFAAHIQYFAAFAGDLNQPISEELSVSQPLMDRMENQMPASIMGYPWARWAVEEVLAKCQDWIGKLHASAADDLQDVKTKFNFTIYRLPNSAVYFNNGRIEFLNPFFAITMTALQQGVVPPGVLPVGPPFLTTPIDISADILVRISRRLHRPTVIHIVNPVGVRREALNQTLLALKIPFRESCEDEFLRGIEKNQNGSAAYTLLPVMRFWRLYWFSEDLDRKDAFPIVTANIEACLPNTLKQFPHPSEVWTRMLAYCLRNYHLVRDPFDAIIPLGFLQNVGASLIATTSFDHMSSGTQNMLKLALRGRTNKEIEQALEWQGKDFVSNPIYGFLSPLE